MTQKELIDKIAKNIQLPREEVEKLLWTTSFILIRELSEGKNIEIPDFGNFEIKKREEKLLVYPVTKKRALFPPKLEVHFKQSYALAKKLNKFFKNE